MRTLQKLRHDDLEAAIGAARSQTPQQRFAAAERLIKLAFEMRGNDGRVQKLVARVVRRER